ncbi:hypothetical protein B1748_16810 [Paenibacillus sp. MY03]|uniref:xylulokinase n=1 Tax=Paenibacillus sp. MY03 TaxID=302980 RepID=UPI000B3CBC66|nr:FGGY family carbohydrate kinase [Paenibacillus sp. MY03]OUS75522.1 hypothetical protein B1748_16810 [Paenibacillus sp. MY03]
MSSSARTNYAIAADVGTQGTKVALVAFDGTHQATAFIPSQLIRGGNGLVEQDPEEMLASVVRGIRSVVEQSGIKQEQIAGIGIDGQMAGLLGIDEDWNTVMPFDSWLDRRCEATMPLIKEWGEEEYIRITGCPVTYAHGPKIIWWRREQSEIYNRIAKFLVPSAYIAGKLAELKAEDAFIDHTHLHFTGFADVEKETWSDLLLQDFDIDKTKMPRIVRPWEVIGGLSSRYAQLTGIAQGTPIVAGCGDTAASILGAGIVSSGQLFDVAGTASVLSCCVDQYKPDVGGKTLIYARSVLPELWTPLAYINGGGGCLSWLREQTGSNYDELNQLASVKQPGSGGLMFIPHYGGRVCPNQSSMKGSWSGLDFAHDKGDLFRSMLEAIAYEYKYYLNTLEQLIGKVDYEEVRVTGGGARSSVFNQIKADVLGIPYRVLDTVDSSLLAGALLVGKGTGMIASIADSVAGLTGATQSYYPDPGKRSQYERHASHYLKTLNTMNDLYRQLKYES